MGDDRFGQVESMWTKLPAVPDGTRCEMDECVAHEELMADWIHGGEQGDEPEHPLAVTQFVRFDNGHACYIFVCDECAETGSDDFEDDWPENADGSLVEPTRCTP